MLHMKSNLNISNITFYENTIKGLESLTGIISKVDFMLWRLI